MERLRARRPALGASEAYRMREARERARASLEAWRNSRRTMKVHALTVADPARCRSQQGAQRLAP